MKRKLFTAALVLIIALALFPSFALADGPVAAIGSTQYDSIQDAVDAAGKGDVVTLIGDASLSDSITISTGKEIVLDLNGHSMNSSHPGAFIVNYGDLTINDSSAAADSHGIGAGCVYTTDTDAQGRAAVENYGTLVINGGIFGDKNIYTTDINDVQRGNAVRNYGIATINGGAFTCCDNYTNGGYAYAIANGSANYPDAVMTINYATAYGSINGILAADSGILTVKDGNYILGDGTETNLWRVVYTSGKGVVNIEGGNYVRNCNTGYGFFGGIVNIYGGTFAENVCSKGIVIDSGNVNIIGGTFDSKVSINANVPVLITGGNFSDFSDLDGYVSGASSTTTEGGTTVVTPNSADNAVASLERGSRTLYYTSLNDAIAEARDGETVEVLKDTTISSALEIKNNITIDGNNNTVTANERAGIYIKADLDNLTITDLTLKGVLPEGANANDGTGSYMGIGTYNDCFGVADLKLTNVTVDGFSYGLYFGQNPAGTGATNNNPVSVTANNLTVQNCYIKGAYFEKLTDSSFTSCKFLNNGTDPNKVANESMRTWMCGVDINLKNGSYKNISFTGCTFTNNGANSGTALLIKARDDGNYGSDTSLDGATVSGCTFSGNNGSYPVIIGEPGKDNKTPVNVSIQPDVKYENNIAEGSVYTVTFKSNGTEYDTKLVAAGTEITLPTPSNSGYIFLGWRCGDVTYKAGEVVKVEEDLTFTAVWGNLPDVDPDDPDEPEVPDFPFYDVSASAWYYDAVKYVYDRGLMDGVDDHEFAPDATLTRAMVWTILARMEGVDTTGGATWYAKAQEWAVAKGISDGENPNAAITREQLVTMFYRLAGEPSVSGSINAPDADSVSSWAKDAMVWAMDIGLIEGDENGAVTPTATATRAQAAAIIMRYIED